MKDILIVIFMFFFISAQARDIDVDKIYIDPDSLSYKNITEMKEKNFQIINAVRADRNIIFAGWVSKERSIYIKEIRSSNYNYIYSYSPKSHKRKKLHFFTGAISFVNFSEADQTLFIRYFNPSTLHGETLIYHYPTGEKTSLPSCSQYKDFSIVYGRNRIIIRKNGYFVSFNYISGAYEDLKIPSFVKRNAQNQATLFPSPDNKHFLIVHGGGGIYRAEILSASKKPIEVPNVASNLDLNWISNSKFIYRSGTPGDYSLNIYDIKENTSNSPVKASLNPGISFSMKPQLVTALKDQVMNILNIRDMKVINSMIEGEESRFSPDRRFFSMIYLGNLYLIRYSELSRKQFSLRRNSCSIYRQYEKADKKSSIYRNSYSSSYIKRKLRLYRKLCKGTTK